MNDLPAAPRTGPRAAVPLSRVAARTCARPGCPGPARATLSFSYGDRRAWLSSLSPRPVPEHYDLCSGHADRTAPPQGWELVDDRVEADDDGPDDGPDHGLGDGSAATAASVHPAGRSHLVATDTVAVLAAALGRDRGPGHELAASEAEVDGDGDGRDDRDPRLFPLAPPAGPVEDRASTW